jgi:putative sugar O-methyltransferase
MSGSNGSTPTGAPEAAVESKPSHSTLAPEGYTASVTSGQQTYLQACEDAVSDEKRFATFKQQQAHLRVVQCVSAHFGLSYWKSAGEIDAEICNPKWVSRFRAVDAQGAPEMTADLPVSATVARYVKQAADIKHAFGLGPAIAAADADASGKQAQPPAITAAPASASGTHSQQPQLSQQAAQQPQQSQQMAQPQQSQQAAQQPQQSQQMAQPQQSQQATQSQQSQQSQQVAQSQQSQQAAQSQQSQQSQKVAQPQLGLLEASEKPVCKWIVIEIGVGYGGLCHVMHEYLSPALYCLVDLPIVLALARKCLRGSLSTEAFSRTRFISTTDLESRVGEFQSLEAALNSNNLSRLAVSNFALSECEEDVRFNYIRQIINRCTHGYFAVNHLHQQQHEVMLQLFDQTPCRRFASQPEPSYPGNVTYFFKTIQSDGTTEIECSDEGNSKNMQLKWCKLSELKLSEKSTPVPSSTFQHQAQQSRRKQHHERQQNRRIERLQKSSSTPSQSPPSAIPLIDVPHTSHNPVAAVESISQSVSRKNPQVDPDSQTNRAHNLIS